MKTTIEIEDGLLLKAKEMAVRRRTTLKAIIEHALLREIQPPREAGYREETEEIFEINEHGVPQLKRSGKGEVTSEMISDLMEEEGI